MEIQEITELQSSTTFIVSSLLWKLIQEQETPCVCSEAHSMCTFSTVHYKGCQKMEILFVSNMPIFSL
jgi:hypothetical protein